MTTSDCKTYCPLRGCSCRRDCAWEMDDGQCAVVHIADALTSIAETQDGALPDICNDLYGIKMDMPGK